MSNGWVTQTNLTAGFQRELLFKIVFIREDSIMEIGRVTAHGAERLYLGVILTVICVMTGVGVGLKNTINPTDSVAEAPQLVSSCKSMSQYQLSNNVRATVCTFKAGTRRLDIRQFIGDKPTIKGIALNYESFMMLDRFWDSISVDMINSDDPSQAPQ